MMIFVSQFLKSWKGFGRRLEKFCLPFFSYLRMCSRFFCLWTLVTPPANCKLSTRVVLCIGMSQVCQWLCISLTRKTKPPRRVAVLIGSALNIEIRLTTLLF